MPQRAATIESLGQAFEMVKAMRADGLEWGEGYRSLGRRALAEIIEGRMAEAVDRWLDALGVDDVADRRNGSYRRRLLSELGDIELCVPRTRRYCPTEVLRACARRSAEIERVILAGFVLGLSTRRRGAGARRGRAGPQDRRGHRRFAGRWAGTCPKAVACLRNDLDELLTCLRYKTLKKRRTVPTTNATERRFRELRPRTRPMGTFQDKTSMDRILLAVFTHENKTQGPSPPFLVTHSN